MKKLLSFLSGTIIMWLPILGAIIAERLASIVTADFILKSIQLFGLAAAVTIIVINRKEAKYEKRNFRANH